MAAKPLYQRKLLDCASDGIIQRISRLGGCPFTRDLHRQSPVTFRNGNISGHQFQKMVCKDVLQEQMESLSVVLMPQMAEFVQKHIILKDTRKTYYIEIEVYIAF